jgi:hypothetical protein
MGFLSTRCLPQNFLPVISRTHPPRSPAPCPKPPGFPPSARSSAPPSARPRPRRRRLQPSRTTARAASARVFCQKSGAKPRPNTRKHSRFRGATVVRLLDLPPDGHGRSRFQPGRKTSTIHGRSAVYRGIPAKFIGSCPKLRKVIMCDGVGR